MPAKKAVKRRRENETEDASQKRLKGIALEKKNAILQQHCAFSFCFHENVESRSG